MDFQRLVVLYADKTDEELLQLGAEADQLTFEAQSALHGEMRKRGLRLEQIAATPISDHGIAETGEENTCIVKSAPVHLPVTDFIKSVLGYYHKHLWVFVKATVPAVFIGTLAILGTRSEAREISRHMRLTSHSALPLGTA